MAADWFWETDAEERVTYLSQRWEEIFQRPRATAIGDFRHENLRRLNASLEQERAYNDTIAKREAFDGFDVEVREDTGKQRFFRLSAQPWFDEQGEFGGYRGTGLDITTERTASLAKRQLAGQLEAVVKHSQSLILKQYGLTF